MKRCALLPIVLVFLCAWLFTACDEDGNSGTSPDADRGGGDGDQESAMDGEEPTSGGDAAGLDVDEPTSGGGEPDGDATDDDAADRDMTDRDMTDRDATDCDSDDDNDGDNDDSTAVSCRILGVEVEDHITYRLANDEYPQMTGDLWPCAWGEDDRLYTSNGDGMGFGSFAGDIVFSVVDGYPPQLVGTTPPDAYEANIAGIWGPEKWKVSRKPTGMICFNGDIYLFFQNLKNYFSDNEFGDAPHASISVTRDGGLTWHYDDSKPMFTDHVFTTGFFLDYGKCQEHAKDRFVYVYGLDYNWRFSDGFSQTKMYLGRVPAGSILDRDSWEFFVGLDDGTPLWSSDIDLKDPVLEDDTLYCEWQSGIAQGSVVYIPQLNRYLYSTRAVCVWIFYEAEKPWGPWTKVSVVEWPVNRWTEDFHAGYNAVIPTKFLDADGLGGWIVTSLSSSWFDGMYYNMGFRRFSLEVEEAP